jgi:SAM-dependent methyltransferase
MTQTTNERKLHLGCYDIVLDGWLNTDVTLQIPVARVPGLAALLFRLGRMSPENYARHRRGLFRRVQYLDVTRRFPFANGTFDYAFSSHMVEHLCPDEAAPCLRELHRVMRPGGIVRLSVPDLDLAVRQYDPAHPETFLDLIFQGRSRRTHPLARHWWHYNAGSLTDLLLSAGFREPARRAFREGRCADVERIDSRPDSLFMEAVR